MSAIQDTAYPRFRSDIPQHELDAVYTPTPNEQRWARRCAKQLQQRFFLLVHLKAYQKQGFFCATVDLPPDLSGYIARCLGLQKRPTKIQQRQYDQSSARNRHINWIRAYVGSRILGDKDRLWLENQAINAAESREVLADIINILLEELVHHRFEIPGFTVLLRLAKDARATVNDRCYRSIVSELTDDTKALINDLLVSPPGIEISGWQRLKREIRKPTNKEIRSYLQHLKWLRDIVERLPSVHAIPVTKRRQFANEARALDVAKMARIPARKRYALAVVLIRQQYAQALDDTAELLIKLMRQLETTAQQNLLTYQMEQTQRTDRLVSCFKDVLTAMEAGPNPWQSLQAVVGDKRQEWLDECEEHLAYAGNNYLPFMLRPFRAKRSLLYNCLDILTFQSTSSDTLSIQLIELLRKNRSLKAETLDLRIHAPDLIENVQQTKWTLDKWRRLIFIRPDSLTVHRKYFELAVLNLVKQELKSADLAVVHGDRFDDHRDQLVSWSGYKQEIDQYGLEVELPMEPKALVGHLKEQLTQVSRSVDAAFPDNTHATIEDGRIVIKRNQRQGLPTNWQALDDDITRRLGTRSIVDVLVDAERWLGLHREFGPLSGYEGRVEDPRLRFIATLFCYGCNLGPSQTADSIKQLNRRQIAWLNLNHVTEDRLDRAIVKVINAYKKYELPGYWGTGRRAAADGTKWNLYEQNLLSEYHIRYGGYGGIGYYHVSDTYIALFSHFIPCGVHEAVYILDGLLENRSDIQPDTLHGDTQAQSYPVFGLSYLLGIKLMPRIRNLKDLNFYRPDRRFRYAHIEELFNGHIDWARIERHLPDMLRVAVSIKLGKITASTILTRLGTYSRKNKLYFAFRELGKVVRTGFLLNYIDDVELRQTIHAATNKNEQFNGFAKWSFFGGSGIIAANLRHEQQKVVKYNHLVANMLILHNVEALSRVLRDMAAEGIAITEDVLKALSPYRTRHINRFGDYTLDLKRPVGQQLFDLKLAELASQGASKARTSVEDEAE